MHKLTFSTRNCCELWPALPMCFSAALLISFRDLSETSKNRDSCRTASAERFKSPGSPPASALQ
eukprot:1142695-Pelagomonas_calceolata.AAC.2